MSRWQTQRVWPEGVTSAPVWDWPTPDGPLWTRIGVPRVEAEDGGGVRMGQDLARLLPDLRARWGATSVAVGGGLTLVSGFTEGLGSAAAVVAGTFAGEAGGEAILGGSGLVIDVGQHAVKASLSGRRTLVRRDVERLPRQLIGTPRILDPDDVVDRVAEMVGAAAADLAGGRRIAPRVVLALPCPLDGDLAAGPCTYGWEGVTDLVPRLLDALDRALGWHEGPGHAFVLNDAELFAETVRVRLSPVVRTLCLSLGFGPGGAVLTP